MKIIRELIILIVLVITVLCTRGIDGNYQSDDNGNDEMVERNRGVIAQKWHGGVTEDQSSTSSSDLSNGTANGTREGKRMIAIENSLNLKRVLQNVFTQSLDCLPLLNLPMTSVQR